MPIIRIVSGAQTGSDRGGLDAAIHCRLPHSGWCPKGRKAEDGVIPARYLLQETLSANYLARTEANVVDSDATVIFTRGEMEGGSLKTAEFARKHGKPWLHVDISRVGRQGAVDTIVGWLQSSCPAECVLNVAGSRESKSPGIAGVVKARMIDVISKANGTLFYPIADDAPSDEDQGEATPTIDSDEAAARGAGSRSSPLDASVALYHPRTMAEAVSILLAALNPETKDKIRASPDREEFVAGSHFGLALWVRNSMVHGNRNGLDLFADFQKGCREGKWHGMAEPDAISGVIVGLVWDALHTAE